MKSIKEDALEMLYLCQSIIAANSDNKKKEVGDKIMIWDGSGNKDKNTGKKRWGIDPLFTKNVAIVIATNLSVLSDIDRFDVQMGFKPYLLDLLVVFPTGEEIYTSSNFVRIV